MITVNIHEAKAKLSEYVSLVEKGEKIVLCRRNIPIAEIVPYPAKTLPKPRRFVGGYEGKMKVTDKALFEPLPKSILKAFLAE